MEKEEDHLASLPGAVLTARHDDTVSDDKPLDGIDKEPGKPGQTNDNNNDNDDGTDKTTGSRMLMGMMDLGPDSTNSDRDRGGSDQTNVISCPVGTNTDDKTEISLHHHERYIVGRTGDREHGGERSSHPHQRQPDGDANRPRDTSPNVAGWDDDQYLARSTELSHRRLSHQLMRSWNPTGRSSNENRLAGVPSTSRQALRRAADNSVPPMTDCSIDFHSVGLEVPFPGIAHPGNNSECSPLSMDNSSEDGGSRVEKVTTVQEATRNDSNRDLGACGPPPSILSHMEEDGKQPHTADTSSSNILDSHNPLGTPDGRYFKEGGLVSIAREHSHEDRGNTGSLKGGRQEDADSALQCRNDGNTGSHDTSNTDHPVPNNDNTPSGDADMEQAEVVQFTHDATPDSKYDTYSCMIDNLQNDRSVEIQLAAFNRPHMRAFHLAWMSFFVAFFTWFSITPLLSEVQRTLNLTKREIWTSSMFGVGSSAVTRVVIGPLCDKYGARRAMAGTLIISAIPTGLTGLVQSAPGLNLLRLFVGVAGSAFVTCQYWASTMFTVEVAGTANAIVAGWGNLGGGVTQVVMGAILFPLFKLAFSSYDNKEEDDGNDNSDTGNGTTNDPGTELAWRSVSVVPSLMCMAMAYFVLFYSDDSPKGNYNKMSKEGYIPKVLAGRALHRACGSLNTWILFVQYGCCFGVEITMVNAAALYFKEVFGLTTEAAAGTASVFGWINLFARGIGGFLSDMANASFGMRGRLWMQVVTLILEGGLVIVFSATNSLGLAILVMIFFSLFVQAAEGATFAIVPYVSPSITGSVAGLVGAGGNVGGVAFALLFRDMDYQNAFKTMGYVVMGSGLLSFFMTMKGLATLCGGKDAPEVLEQRVNRAEQLGGRRSVLIEDPDASAHHESSWSGSVSQGHSQSQCLSNGNKSSN